MKRTETAPRVIAVRATVLAALIGLAAGCAGYSSTTSGNDVHRSRVVAKAPISGSAWSSHDGVSHRRPLIPHPHR